jgi:hypothetical protein
VTAQQFEEIRRWEPQFRERLREWGLNSGEPIATSVVADSDADVAKIIASHPDADYYLPTRLRPALEGAATHELVVASDQRFFLLARQKPERPVSTMRFNLPRNW